MRRLAFIVSVVALAFAPSSALAWTYVPNPGSSTGPSPADAAALFWAVDPQNSSGVANDTNLCWGVTEATAALTPCRTYQAIWNRLAGANYPVNTIVEIYQMSDQTVPISVSGSISFQGLDQLNSFGGFLAIKGKPTVIRSGTLTAGTAARAGHQPQIVVDSTLATTWAATTCGTGSQTCVGDTTHSVWIRDTTVANCHAEMQFDANATLAKSAHTSQPVVVSEVPGQQIGQTNCSFSSGDTYDIYTLPKLAGVTVGGATTLRIYTMDITALGGTAQLGNNSSATYTVLDGVINAVIVNTVLREYVTSHTTVSLGRVDLSLNNGCTSRGGNDTWIAISLTTTGNFTLNNASIDFLSGNYSTRGGGPWNLFFYDYNSYAFTFDGPSIIFIDSIEGGNNVVDQPFRIRSGGVTIYNQNTSFSSTWTADMHGGNFFLINGVQFFGNQATSDFPYHNSSIGVDITLWQTGKTDMSTSTIQITSGAVIAAGSCITATGILADSTDGTKPCIGVSVKGCGSGALCTAIREGTAPGVLTSATAGTKYWLSTSGALTTTQPVAAGRGQDIVGYALNATDLYVQISDFGVHP